MEHLSHSTVIQTLFSCIHAHAQQYKEGVRTIKVRNSSYSPSSIRRNKNTNDTKTPHYYLVKFFYSADQVGVTGGVFKEYIICKRTTHRLILCLTSLHAVKEHIQVPLHEVQL